MGVFALHLVLQLAGLYLGIVLVLNQVENLDPAIERGMMSTATGLLFATTILLVVGWIVVTGIIHYGSGGSQTNGTVADALVVAGWAYAPEVVAFLPSFLYRWRQIQQFSFDGSDPTRLATEFEAIQAALAPSLLSFPLLLLTTIWSLYILTYGIAETHEVPVETAAVPAVFVDVGSMLLTLLG